MSDPTAFWTDNHCHLPEDLDAAGEAVAVAAAAGVTRLIDVGTDLDRSRAAIERSRRFSSVWATVGLHPHDAVNGIGDVQALLEEALRSGDRVVAVGECGLDYHYDHSPREVQREVFAQQIQLAHQHDLPLVIHSRSAWDDTFAVLETEGLPANTVFHCFTGGPTEGERALALGAVLSFSGIVTFPSATDLREAAALCPLESLMVETDSPYLTPVPHRGQPNRPALVSLVGAKIAEVKDHDLDDVARVTSMNAERFYRL